MWFFWGEGQEIEIGLKRGDSLLETFDEIGEVLAFETPDIGSSSKGIITRTEREEDRGQEQSQEGREKRPKKRGVSWSFLPQDPPRLSKEGR